MNIVLASFMGMLVTLMITFNSVLSVKAGQVLSLLVFHMVGFSTISVFLLFTAKKENHGKMPLYLCSAGVIGVVVVFFNNLCFSILGASVTLALVVMGQSIGSILTDTTGFLNMKKHPFNMKKLSGFVLILSGILLMVEKWEFHTLYIILAFVTGMLVILTLVLNSQLALRIGVFNATRMNYFVGLITVIPIILFSGLEINSFKILSGIHPIYIFGGGVFGVFIVIGFNYVVPKIPTIYTTILMFLGQITTGLMIDWLMGRDLSVRMLTGSVIVFLGLAINMWIGKLEEGTYQSPGQKNTCLSE